VPYQLSAAQVERLALLVEELGEASQAAGKILRHGFRQPGLPYDNARDLSLELGDVLYGRGFRPPGLPYDNARDLSLELGDVLYAVSLCARDLDLSLAQQRCAEKLKARPHLHEPENIL